MNNEAQTNSHWNNIKVLLRHALRIISENPTHTSKQIPLEVTIITKVLQQLFRDQCSGKKQTKLFRITALPWIHEACLLSTTKIFLKHLGMIL